MTGLYIHIPFCFKKCNYCDFVSQDYETFAADAYINALSAEMQKYYGASIETVYIGGGTPSTFSVGQLEKLFKLIPKYFNLSHVKEFTVELNPESTTLEKLSLLKNNGVTRLSIGFQSPNDEELAFLGRAHNSSKFEEVLSQARSLFNNINIDLMYGFQSFDGWQNNLAQTLKFKPEHLSLYPLAVEEGTPFHKNGIKVDYNLQAKMY
ncbi:MAG: radical SAM protein, partial [Elusimicrobia bacterium]|nr:radical SAM protein [Elusimicrobiota bacterium]